MIKFELWVPFGQYFMQFKEVCVCVCVYIHPCIAYKRRKDN